MREMMMNMLFPFLSPRPPSPLSPARRLELKEERLDSVFFFFLTFLSLLPFPSQRQARQEGAGNIRPATFVPSPLSFYSSSLPLPLFPGGRGEARCKSRTAHITSLLPFHVPPPFLLSGIKNGVAWTSFPPSRPLSLSQQFHASHVAISRPFPFPPFLSLFFLFFSLMKQEDKGSRDIPFLPFSPPFFPDPFSPSFPFPSSEGMRQRAASAFLPPLPIFFSPFSFPLFLDAWASPFR